MVQCIKDIREALSDDAHQIIKTMPRRGYLFAAELSDKRRDEPHHTTGTRGQEITFCRTEDGVNLPWRVLARVCRRVYSHLGHPP